MAAKLWKQLILVVTVAKAKHLETDLAGHANVFMMLSASLSCSQRLFKVCQRAL